MKWIKQATSQKIRDEVRDLEQEINETRLEIELPSEDSFMDGLKKSEEKQIVKMAETLKKIKALIEEYKAIKYWK